MNSKDLKTLRELLQKQRKIVIIPHKNPDGDAIGACLALWHYLSDAGQDPDVISPNDYPKFLKWMPGTEQVLNFEREQQRVTTLIADAEIIFTLDFNHLSRTGGMQRQLELSDAFFVMVDHHREPDDYATITFSDSSMSSTCEMIFNLIEGMGDIDKISPEIAHCLFSGILTDTGSFKYASTTSRTHRVAALLIDHGANNTEIHRRIFDTNTPERLQLLGCALGNMVILDEYSTAYISLRQEELDKYQFKKGDTEGFVNYGLTIEGIRFAVIFIENQEEGIIKISFRSEGTFSVNDFARSHFGGGGHMNAAGGRSDLSMDETIAYFKSLLIQYKEQLNQ